MSTLPLFIDTMSGSTYLRNKRGGVGPTGPAGIAGTGVDGATGPAGVDGATGPAGPAGVDGATGATGPAGVDGATGPAGVDGATGPAGPTGPAGVDGAVGSSGFSALNSTIWAGSPPSTLEEAINRLSMIVYARTASSGLLPAVSANTKVLLNIDSRGGQDAYITKFSANGDAQWVASITSTAADSALFVGVDSSENVYVAGNFSATLTIKNANGSTFGTLPFVGASDVYLIKYDPYGTVLWATRIASGGTEVAWGMMSDADGNTVITGNFASSGLIFYNSDGSTAASLTVGGANDSYIAKYNPAGFLIWANKVTGTSSEEAKGIAIDSNGDTYFTGSINGTATLLNVDGSTFGTLATAGSQDVIIVKYNVSGNVLWAIRCGSPSDDRSNFVTVDSAGNVYVCGYYVNQFTVRNADGSTFKSLSWTLGSDCFLIKYDTNGVALWATSISGSGATDQLRGISVDAAGNVFVIAEYAVATSGSGLLTLYNADNSYFPPLLAYAGNDVFLAKYSSSGFVQWVTRLGGVGGDTVTGVDCDSDGNIYVCGNQGNVAVALNSDGTLFSTLAGGGYIVKYDTNGFGMWYANTPAQFVKSSRNTSLYVAIQSAVNAPLVVRSAGL